MTKLIVPEFDKDSHYTPTPIQMIEQGISPLSHYIYYTHILTEQQLPLSEAKASGSPLVGVCTVAHVKSISVIVSVSLGHSYDAGAWC